VGIPGAKRLRMRMLHAACCQAMEAGHFEDAPKSASLYLMLFPGY
jgi:hypothetical protein